MVLCTVMRESTGDIIPIFQGTYLFVDAYTQTKLKQGKTSVICERVET